MNFKITDFEEKIYIIILNYNSAMDTVECLRSLKKIDLFDYSQIILVDNKSTDSSEKVIDDFLRAEFSNYVKINKKQKEYIYVQGKDDGSNIVFIKSDENKGFSAGNNIALSYINKKRDGNYFWFLNNDTIQDKYALLEMIGFMNKESLVLTSSVLCDYIMPNRIQAIGIRLNRPIYTMPIVGRTEILTEENNFNNDKISKSISYDDIRQLYPDIYALPGASFMMNKEGLELIGGKLDESYQFYFEEAEIARKIKGQARYAPCLSSVVWHKGGGSAVSKGNYFTSYHTVRSRMIFIKRYELIDLPLAISFIFIKIMYLIIIGKLTEALGMLQGLFAGIIYNSQAK